METPIQPQPLNNKSFTVATVALALLLGGCTSEKPSTFTDEPGSFNTIVPTDTSTTIPTIKKKVITEINLDQLSQEIDNNTPKQVYEKITSNTLNLMLTLKALKKLQETEYFERAKSHVKNMLYNLILAESKRDSTITTHLFDIYRAEIEQMPNKKTKN